MSRLFDSVTEKYDQIHFLDVVIGIYRELIAQDHATCTVDSPRISPEALLNPTEESMMGGRWERLESQH